MKPIFTRDDFHHAPNIFPISHLEHNTIERQEIAPQPSQSHNETHAEARVSSFEFNTVPGEAEDETGSRQRFNEESERCRLIERQIKPGQVEGTHKGLV